MLAPVASTTRWFRSTGRANIYSDKNDYHSYRYANTTQFNSQPIS
jgi:hypothetical protein